MLKEVKKQDWYKDPQMVGHRIAIENVEHAEKIIKKYSKTPLQKWLLECLDPETKLTWNYWACNGGTKSAWSLNRFILRRIDTHPAHQVLVMEQQRTGMLKSRLTHALEVHAYAKDCQAYQTDYAKCVGFYGMGYEEALDRLESYIEKLVEKRNIPQLPVV